MKRWNFWFWEQGHRQVSSLRTSLWQSWTIQVGTIRKKYQTYIRKEDISHSCSQMVCHEKMKGRRREIMHKNLLYLVTKCNKSAGYKISTYQWIANNELQKKKRNHTLTEMHMCMHVLKFTFAIILERNWESIKTKCEKYTHRSLWNINLINRRRWHKQKYFSLYIDIINIIKKQVYLPWYTDSNKSLKISMSFFAQLLERNYICMES